MESSIITVQCQEDFRDILIAEFSEIGYDAFMENEEGFKASIDYESVDNQDIEQIKKKYQEISAFNYQLQKAEKKNWNKEWESSYDPIFVDNKCVVRASFHNLEKRYPFEIIINPKMSFGTGHHATTFMMLKQQLAIDHHNKTVLDVGCGTGILSIMAYLLGASRLYACDIDSWCIENSNENFLLNNCQAVDIRLGEVNQFKITADLIIANINRNVLLNDMTNYFNMLNSEGQLLMSGFYQEDNDVIVKKAKSLGLILETATTKNQWSSLLFKK